MDRRGWGFLPNPDDRHDSQPNMVPEWDHLLLAKSSQSYYSQLSPKTLAITTANLPEGFVSVVYGSNTSLYSNQLAYTGGGGGPYTWSITSGRQQV